MADTPVIFAAELSPEQIAYKLLTTIASNEGRTLTAEPGQRASADRGWLLNTYAECLMAIHRPQTRVRR